MTLTGEPKDYPNGDLNAFDHHRHEYTAGGGGVPAGVIALWSGSVATIPSGWYLCDGANGTPDLRDRFVLAAGGAANPGDSGGAASLSHAGTAVAAHVVTQPAAHTDHADNIAHSHTQRYFPTATGGSIGYTVDTSMSGTQTNATLTTASSGTGASLAHSAHTGTAVDAHAVTQPNDHADSRPPFYALAYIMKS